MTRIISVLSGKGGVGKTTTVTNLAAALAKHGIDVTIVDANVTTPNLGLHLGVSLYPITLHDVLQKRAEPEMAVYEHPAGFRVIPASLSVDSLKEELDLDRLNAVLISMLGKSQVVIVDAAAGLGREAMKSIEVADELVVVTNPELPAVTDALKTIRLAQNHGTKILGVVVNRVKNQKHEMSRESIEEMLDVKILAYVPEDLNVQRSIAEKMPVVHYKPRTRASVQFRRLAAEVMGEGFEAIKEESWLDRLFSWLM